VGNMLGDLFELLFLVFFGIFKKTKNIMGKNR
jgi:hypothetical protein